MPTYIKTGLWENSTTTQVPKGWLNLTKLIKDNSGGSSGNYIPLTGTEYGKPVTGDIIIEHDADKSIRSFNEYGEAVIIFNRNFSISNANYLNGTNSSIGLTDGGDIYISSTGSGIMSDQDHSDNSTENKLVYAQRSYVEKPETLINCLNNATPTQLSTIKSILGIL